MISTRASAPAPRRPSARAGEVRLAAGLLLLGLVGAAGCAGKGDVSGQVTYSGKPLPAGRITFLCEAGNRPAISATITDGQYTGSGCPAGPAKVAVDTCPPHTDVNLKAVPAAMKTMMADMKEKTKERMPEGAETYETAPGKYVKIPPRYANPEQSGLTCTVTSGKQQHDVALTP